MIYQWLRFEVSIFYTLKELLCMFSHKIQIQHSNILQKNLSNTPNNLLYEHPKSHID